MGRGRRTFVTLVVMSIWLAVSLVRRFYAIKNDNGRTQRPQVEAEPSARSERIETAAKECRKFEDFLKLHSWEESVPQMIVDDQRKVLFCAIPKVASSNWKRVFIKALNITINGTSSIRNVHIPGILPNLRDFSKEEQERRLKYYFKFMFVRHPLERLLSAYRNKYENRDVAMYSTEKQSSGNQGHVSYTQEKILKVMKANSSRLSIAPQKITFRQFVHTLTDPLYTIKRYNVHWKQYHKLCHPCFVKYDFIGKLETLQDDLAYIRQKTGLTHSPWFEKSSRKTTPEVLRNYYQSVSSTDLRVLRDMYSTDTLMFGYS